MTGKTKNEVIGEAVLEVRAEVEAVPRILDPGGGGWPEAPKVTRAEELLYGEFAPAIRLLGQAASNAADAYGLICKELVNEDQSDWTTDVIGKAYRAYSESNTTHRRIAAIVLELMEERSEMGISLSTEPTPVIS